MGVSNKLLVLITTLMLAMVGSMVQGEAGSSFSFNSFGGHPVKSNLTYQGDAHVPTECKFLRLTKTNDEGVPGHWSTGRVLYSKPVLIREANFDTTIKFTIAPSKYNAADGLAFFIAPVGTTIPFSLNPLSFNGGNLAIYDSSGVGASIFAVEFDTYQNPWDPNYRHIGINLYSRISYNLTKFDSATGEEVTARITYVASTSTITVVATTCTQTATLTYVVNLSSILPQNVQVGIASSTGWPSDNIGVHDIHSWSFTSNIANVTTHDVDTYTRRSAVSM